MAKSLQEQLMGAGLVDKKKAKDIQKEKRTKRKQTPKGQQHVDENKARIEQQKLEKAAKDRALNKQQQEEKERKAIKAQIKQLILVNEIKRDESADESFQFVVDNKIKKIFVSGEQLNLLSKGRLAIGQLAEEYYLVPSIVADKINERDTDNTIVYRFTSENKDTIDDDDPYKDFVVPDDLMW